MDVTPLIRDDLKIIQAYADGYFRVSGKKLDGSVLVHGASVEPWKNIETLEELSSQDLERFKSLKDHVDIFLIGTGKTQKFFPPALNKEARKLGLTFDLMDTGAACRTYNVLIAEGRRVCAALLPYA